MPLEVHVIRGVVAFSITIVETAWVEINRVDAILGVRQGGFKIVVASLDVRASRTCGVFTTAVVVSGIPVEVARRGVCATRNLVAISHSIIICINGCRRTVHAFFASLNRKVTAAVVVGGFRVVVACYVDCAPKA